MPSQFLFLRKCFPSLIISICFYFSIFLIPFKRPQMKLPADVSSLLKAFNVKHLHSKCQGSLTIA